MQGFCDLYRHGLTTDKPYGIVNLMELKTFVAWNVEGRVVKKGEHAEFYAVDPSNGNRYALFAFEQTEPATIVNTADWDIVPVAKLPPKPKTDKRPVFRYKYVNGRVDVYVNTAEGRQTMKKSGFKWYPPTGRWHKDLSKAQVEAMIASFKRWGFRVVDEGKGAVGDVAF